MPTLPSAEVAPSSPQTPTPSLDSSGQEDLRDPELEVREEIWQEEQLPELLALRQKVREMGPENLSLKDGMEWSYLEELGTEFGHPQSSEHLALQD